MKRIAIVLVALALIASPLFAAGITDSTKPLGHMKWSMALEDNYVFNRDIEKLASRDKFEFEKINQIYGKATLGFTPYFNIYAKLGGSDSGEIKTNNLATGNSYDLESKYGFLWGLGVSGAKEFWEGWKLGLDAQFNYWKADADKIKSSYGDKATRVSGDIKNFEFQGTPFITKKFDFPESGLVFNPYLGVKFSYFKTESDNIKYTLSAGDNRTDSWSLKGDNNVGIVVGSNLEFAEKWAMQLEGRFIDEAAMTVGASYRF